MAHSDAPTKNDLALDKAMEHGDIDAMVEAIERGARVNHVKAGAWTPLMNACYMKRPDMVGMLIARGADAALAAVDGSTSALAACVVGSAPCLRIVMDAGADPLRAPDGRLGPLMAAAQAGDPECVAILLACGAEVDARCRATGLTAASMCSRQGHAEALALLLGAGADPMALSDEPIGGARAADTPKTCLHQAAHYGRLDCLRLLLERGADPAWRDAKRRDALAICQMRGDLQGAALVKARLLVLWERQVMGAAAAPAERSSIARRM